MSISQRRIEKGMVSRRDFMKGTAVATAAFSVVPSWVLGQNSPSSKINIAGIGSGGKWAGNLNACKSENIVALCDVDWDRAGGSFKKWPNAKRFKDFREMLDVMGDKIDAAIIATPDHTHAVAAMACMKKKKHVYVQKPLTRTVYEARMLTEAARKYGVKTQMGNQGHSGEGIRLICEWIWDGAIGNVKEVHCWTNRPVWPQGIDRPKEKPSVPASLDWDLWLGPAPYRPYHPTYLPFNWRAWLDFGCGALGDMACHVVDAAFTSLKLKYPTSVQASHSYDVPKMWTRFDNKETYPRASIVHYQFPARAGMSAVKLHWYDGGILPAIPDDMETGRKIPESGTIFVGDKGSIVCGTYADSPRIFPESKMRAYKRPTKHIPRVPGGEGGHEQDWVRACKSDYKACSNFDYAGPFSETVVMGNMAVLNPGKRLLWDGENMKITNDATANKYVNPPYRSGWSL